jgi:predicted permease
VWSADSSWVTLRAFRQASRIVVRLQRTPTAARIPRMSSLLTDLRWAWRGVRARRLKSLAHVLLVALAVGASAVVFSAADAFVFNRAPYPHAARLVVFERSSPVGIVDGLSYEEEQTLSRRTDLFAGLYGHFMGPPVTVTVEGAARLIRTQDVDRELFDALGVRPRWGRGFQPGDERASAEPLAAIGEELARELFGDPATALGRTLESRTGPLRVIGIMPADFRFPTALERIWRVTDAVGPQPSRSRQVVAVLAPGATPAAVERAMTDAVGSQVRGPVTVVPLARAQKDPRAYTNYGAYSGVDAPRLFMTLLAASLCLALIVAVNVAGLELATRIDRSRVHGILTALGATRATLVRTTLLESAILTGAGAAVGVAIAASGTTALAAALPQALGAMLANPIDLDLRAGVFTGGVALAASLLTTLPAIWQLSRRNPADGLRPRGASFSGSQALRHLLLTAQVALCAVLAAGAVLFVRTYAARLNEDKGFDSANLATVEISASRTSNPPAAIVERGVLDALRRHPAVRAVSRSQGLPPHQRGGTSSHVWIAGQSAPAGQAAFRTFGVDPDTFGTMGMSVLRGRGIQASDPPTLAVVDEAFARHFWPDGAAVGARFSLGREQMPGSTTYEIVGVASRLRLDAAEAPEGGRWHVMHRAIPAGTTPLTFVARLASRAALGDVTAAVRGASGDAMVRTGWMDDRYAEVDAGARIAAGLTGGFGIIALCVAMAGVYAVTAFLVARRTREIGIRIALGAERRHIRRLVVMPAVRSVLIGTIAGTAVALAAARLVESQLFGVTAADPSTYVGVVAVVVLTSLVATWRPARRAAALDPTSALRAE